jgi:hypothetical protein
MCAGLRPGLDGREPALSLSKGGRRHKIHWNDLAGDFGQRMNALMVADEIPAHKRPLLTVSTNLCATRGKPRQSWRLAAVTFYCPKVM